MRTVIAALLCLYAIPAGAQDCQTLSPNGQAALYYFVHSESALGFPADFGLTPGVTRRFATTALTYRIVGNYSNQAKTNIRNATRFYAYILNDGPCPAGVTLTEVPATDAAATITFQRTATFTLGGITVPVGCANSPYESPDTFTYTRAWVNSNPNRSGCDGQWLMVHELTHLFTALFHKYTSNNQLLGLLEKSEPSYCKWQSGLTPEQNAQRACNEPMPGFWEVSRWIYRQAPGTQTGL
jgi:hypothetical protein